MTTHQTLNQHLLIMEGPKTSDMFITVPATIEGALEVVNKVLGDSDTPTPVIEALRVRQKYRLIREEYHQLKKKKKAKQALIILSEKYHYSEKTIQEILYR